MLANDLIHRHARKPQPLSVPSPRSSWYGALLVLAKLFKCVGIFIISDLLTQVHVVLLLFLIYLITSVFLLPAQKPLSAANGLRSSDWVKIVQLAFFGVFVNIIWLYGLTLVGPLRTILIFEHNPLIVVAAISALAKGAGGPARVRGAVIFLLGLLSLMLLDSDAPPVEQHVHSESHSHHHGLNHFFYYLFATLGMSDHKSGVLLLVGGLLLQCGYDNAFRRIAVEVGGSKKLYAATQLCSLVISTPLAALFYISSQANIDSAVTFVVQLSLAVSLVFVLHFYIDAVCSQHMDALTLNRWYPIVTFVSAFGVSMHWADPYAGHHATTMEPLADAPHHWSGGLIIAIALFCISTFTLTTPTGPRARSATYIGLDSSGRPIYEMQDFLRRSAHSVTAFAKDCLKQVWAKPDSRRIFYFLCANLAFCGVEFLYGVWTNSLGLISDGFHMLFDCSALVMGLVASVMSNWPAGGAYTFGYGRVEVLSGFINALFLIVIAFAIFMEALGRLFDPPEVRTEKLLLVSVIGLIINLFGMFAFHEGHGHSHGGGGGDHGHSHHGHSHGGGNANMQGVFLHVLADTLGSVAVIFSSILISNFGWLRVDPFCSLLLAILIFLSVLPLLKSSASVLLQCVPDEQEDEQTKVLERLLHLDGVQSYSRAHFWQLKSDWLVLSIHVQLAPDANQQRLTQLVLGALRHTNAQQITLQIEKDAFFQKISASCPSYEIAPRVRAEPLMSRAI